MFDQKLIKDLESDFKGKLLTLTKDEKNHLVDKDTMRGKLLGIFTSAYYKRYRLFEQGMFAYSYVFKSWNNSFGSDKPYPVWMLFSPEEYFLKSPYELENITAKLGQFVKEYEQKDKINRKLFINLTEPLSEPTYFQLPMKFSNNHLVYLHMTYLSPTQLPHFTLGYNVVCFNPNISKEVMFLPEYFWTKEYKNNYLKIAISENLIS